MLQRKGVLLDPTLPEDIQLALAKNVHKELFYQVVSYINGSQ